jgi:hypothetical protein
MLTVIYLHAVATLIMVGVIWVIQLVHYPLFQLVGRENFSAYERSHTIRIGFIVIPVMLLEAGTTGILVFLDGSMLTLLGAGLLVLVWGATALLQVPCHEQLAVGFEESVWRRLVQTNWLRTIAWTARGGVALALLHYVVEQRCP